MLEAMAKIELPKIEVLPTQSLQWQKMGPKVVDVLRLDRLHPQISGNKWYKLKHNLNQAKALGLKTLLSCGGPHSNHLHALAYAGKYFGMKTHALVRGYQNLPLTPTLQDCKAAGMTIEFVDKKTYRQRYDERWCRDQADKNNAYWVPEGGNNDFGKQGAAEIAQYCAGYDEVWLSIGSGCTFIGIAQAPDFTSKLQGVMAIKGGQELKQSMLAELARNTYLMTPDIAIDCESHLGGFGHCPEELLALIQRYDQLGLPLDPVYTGKLLMAFEQAWLTGKLDHEKRYLIIHSGGLQGRRGVEALVDSLP